MVTYVQHKGSDPIMVELRYEDWRKLERMSNRDDKWIEKAYDLILGRARLPSLSEIRKKLGTYLRVQEVVLAKEAYERFEALLKKKYGHTGSMISLQFGPSMVIREEDPEITPNQIIIRPQALGLEHWDALIYD